LYKCNSFLSFISKRDALDCALEARISQCFAARSTIARQIERLMAIRLRCSINTHFEYQGLATLEAIGAAASLPVAEAVRLLIRRQWREGDVAALKVRHPAPH
jgi:hypothetical protein